MGDFAVSRVVAAVAAVVTILGSLRSWYFADSSGGAPGRTLIDAHPGLAGVIITSAGCILLVALVSLTIAPNDRPNIDAGAAGWTAAFGALGVASALIAKNDAPRGLDSGVAPVITIVTAAVAVVATVVVARWARRGAPG